MIRYATTLVVAATFLLAAFAGQQLSAQYHWTPAQIQGLADVTPSFHGGAGQLSTINSITNIPGGIELDITFAIGQEDDPFAPNYGLGFARVSLAGGLGSPGLDVGAFPSSALNITTTRDLTVQSFLQTDFTEDGGAVDDGDGTPDEAFSFLFWEHSDSISTGGPTVVDFDFSMGTEFDTNWDLPSPQQVQGTNAIRQWGMQLAVFDGSIVVGQPVNATVQITTLVPEPSSLAVMGLAALILAAGRRRRT